VSRILIARFIVGLLQMQVCFGQEANLTPPQQATAGDSISIPTSGNGKATFYLVGPGSALKQTIRLGEAVQLGTSDLNASGRYVAVLCADTCKSSNFFVAPAAVSTLSFLAHPSRALVRQNDAISGVLFPFDKFQNLVTTPLTVNFQLSANKANLFSRSMPTRLGVAWFRSSSGNKAGVAQLTASVNNISAQRVLQLVASDPCNLRIKAQQIAKGVLVETDAVHDCSGNIVPDGTIVSFTANSSAGRSTVDAPIKRGIARAQLTPSGATTISAASGVVMGNELRMEVKP
jgi:hypothetical protein